MFKVIFFGRQKKEECKECRNMHSTWIKCVQEEGNDCRHENQEKCVYVYLLPTCVHSNDSQESVVNGHRTNTHQSPGMDTQNILGLTKYARRHKEEYSNNHRICVVANKQEPF